MKLPDDLKISIPIEIDIDINTAQIMCHNRHGSIFPA